jgi:hypothetical protein
MTRFEPHLESVLLAIDVGIEVNPAISELRRACRCVAAADLVAVMTVHENFIYSLTFSLMVLGFQTGRKSKSISSTCHSFL